MDQTEPTSLRARRIARGLRALADQIESGQRPVPAQGRGLRRVAGSPVVPLVVHDALCGWRIATPQGEEGEPNADVLHCAGCGICYLRAEAAEAADR